MFLLFFIALGFGINCWTINRDLLLDCFSKHIDTNHDGNLTRAEVDVVRKSSFFSFCDVNMDRVLNLYDWNDPEGCCKFNPCISNVCEICIKKFNWTGV